MSFADQEKGAGEPNSGVHFYGLVIREGLFSALTRQLTSSALGRD